MNAKDTSERRPEPFSVPKTLLVGTGVVGRAILHSHLAAGVCVCVTDQDSKSLHEAARELKNAFPTAHVRKISLGENELPTLAIHIGSAETRLGEAPWLVIESIAEQLEIKQVFYQNAEAMFGDDAILCSNTSTLEIGSIAAGLRRPQRVCGMHFFMPVDQRGAVEVVRGGETDEATIDACINHVRRINKSPLVVADRPGFIVNRLLSPYLNQSLLLLTHGVSADRIQRAALAYGMPMSPLELIDYIGTRTTLAAGRCFYQAFPSRLDPSLVVPRLIKKKRLGRHTGAGLYDYVTHTGESATENCIQRSESLSQVAQGIVREYSVDPITVSDGDLVKLLAVVMWIEAALAFRDGVTTQVKDFDIAMQGGLGYQSQSGWLDYFEVLGSAEIRNVIASWSPKFASLRAPDELLDRLAKHSPVESIQRW